MIKVGVVSAVQLNVLFEQMKIKCYDKKKKDLPAAGGQCQVGWLLMHSLLLLLPLVGSLLLPLLHPLQLPLHISVVQC